VQLQCLSALYILLTIYSLHTVNQGVSPRDASYFVGKSFLSIVQDAELDCDNPHRFDDLINEQTPGGLNEQVSARDLFMVLI
jgi:hypothetical protein